MLGFVEPSPNVNVPCSIFHNPFPRALRGIWVRVSRQAAFGTPNAMLAHPRGCPFWDTSRRETNPAAMAAIRLPGGPFSTPVPAWSFRTCYSNPVFFQQVYWKNSSSIMGHYLLSFVHGSLPAAAVRNEQPSASPPFQNKKPALRSAFRNFVPSWDEVDLWLHLTSCQLGRKSDAMKKQLSLT